MVDFQLQDYRLHNNSYDRVVSVDMFEHVGKAAYQKFFACVDQALGDEGIALIHTIANQRRAGVVNPCIRRTHSFRRADDSRYRSNRPSRGRFGMLTQPLRAYALCMT